jgi:hypothetical protein
VGNENAKHNIVYKISSALMASTKADRTSPTPDTGVYTVVPISTVGSSELLETSTTHHHASARTRETYGYK